VGFLIPELAKIVYRKPSILLQKPLLIQITNFKVQI
jgi:hypothetical protein